MGLATAAFFILRDYSAVPQSLQFSHKSLFLSLNLNILGQFNDLIMRNKIEALISVERRTLHFVWGLRRVLKV